MYQLPAWSGLTVGTPAAVGATVAGVLLANPLTAAAAGTMGLIGGTTVGDRLTSGRRKLTSDELEDAREIFRDSVNLQRIRLTRDHTLSLGAPKGIRYTIHLKSDWGHFVEDSLELTHRGRIVLIHEIGHVWQFENGGYSYMHKSLWAQYRAYRTTGSRNGAYNWEEAIAAGLDWCDWNPEQQATIIEDYYRCWLRKKEGTAEENDNRLMEQAVPFLELVHNRRGAPRFFRRKQKPQTNTR